MILQSRKIKDIRYFYENKHMNPDLLTCNFTKMTDEKVYKALDWATVLC